MDRDQDIAGGDLRFKRAFTLSERHHMLYGVPQDRSMVVSQFEEVFNGEILGKKKYIRDLSKGNQKKVGLISALLGNPDLVIWDEPFSNLDPSTQLRVRGLISDYSANRTFLISSHDLNHIAEVCTRIIILDHGKLVKDVQRSEISKADLVAFFTPA